MIQPQTVIEWVYFSGSTVVAGGEVLVESEISTWEGYREMKARILDSMRAKLIREGSQVPEGVLSIQNIFQLKPGCPELFAD